MGKVEFKSLKRSELREMLQCLGIKTTSQTIRELGVSQKTARRWNNPSLPGDVVIQIREDVYNAIVLRCKTTV